MGRTCWALAIGALLLGCTGGGKAEREAELGVVAWEQYVEWNEAMAGLPPETVEWIANFSDSVPEVLPELALPQVHFIDAGGRRPISGDLVLEAGSDGFADAHLLIGNPSSRDNRAESVVRLRNSEQIACAPDASVWELAVPAQTVAFLPLEIEASAGDRLDILLIPSEQAGYPFPFSVSFLMFVGHRSSIAVAVAVTPSERVWPFDGCGFARVLHDPPPLETVRNPPTTERNAALSLLIETCEPNETMRLVAIGDRHRVISIDDPIWRSPVTVEGQTALTPLESAWFSDAQEFQIVVIRDEFGNGHGPIAWFSDAISFEE